MYREFLGSIGCKLSKNQMLAMSLETFLKEMYNAPGSRGNYAPFTMVWGQTTHPSQLLQADYTFSGCCGTQKEYESVCPGETQSRRAQGWADQGSLTQGLKSKGSSNKITEGREAFPEGRQHYVGQSIGRLR